MAKRKRSDEEPEEKTQEQPQDTAEKKPPKSDKAFEVPIEGKKPIPCERHGNSDSTPDLIFTHGAGGGLEAPAMQDFAAGFSQTSNLVMFKGNMNLKSRVSGFQAVMGHEKCRPALGGRSMGARAACLAAAQESEGKVEALVLVSFPLVGAQKGDSREQILLDLPEDVHVLFVSGTEDTMCDVEHLMNVIREMKAPSWIVEVEGADHGMAVKRHKAGSQPVRKMTGEIAARWLQGRDEGKRCLSLRWDDEEQVVVNEGWQEASAEGEDGDGDEPSQA